MRLVLSRLAGVIITLAGVSLLAFGAAALAPGDYLDEARVQAGIGVETMTAWRARHGLDDPWAVRYGRWLRGAVQGELGTSIVSGVPVSSLIGARTGRTLMVAGASTVCAWMLAIPLGLVSVARAGHLDGRGTDIATASLLAVPDIVLALAMAWLAVATGSLPPVGSALLPVLVLTLALMPSLVRHVRDTVASVLTQPWVQATRARGVPRHRVLFAALHVAAPPLCGLFGLSLGTMVGAALPVEVVFGWPGLGPLLVDATLSRDLPVVVGAALVGTVVMAMGQVVGDLCLWAADPRVR